MALILATIGCVTGVLGFLFGSAALIWAIGSARSTHRIEYAPLPDPFTAGNVSDPTEEAEEEADEDDFESSEPRAERDAAKKPKIITSFSDIYGDPED